MNKIGILYDNCSGNTGDAAIGISLKKILNELEVEFDELIPGNFNPLDYDTIIIGGGYLLRPSPDFFYDKFRVPGNHILNAMGIYREPEDLDYLNSYKYVTVRSNGDKKKLAYLNKDIRVIPCTTMLLEDVPNLLYALKKPCIGIHVLPVLSKNEEVQFIRWVSSLPFTIYFIPITHFNKDIQYMRYLKEKIPNAEILPILKAEEIFTLCGKFDYFFSCSLHGAIFSYVHNVPFVLFSAADKINAADKMKFFLEDRNLEFLLINDFSDLERVFQSIRDSPPDFSKRILEDKKALRLHMTRLMELLPGPSQDNPGISEKSTITEDQNLRQIPGSQLGIDSQDTRKITDISEIRRLRKQLFDLSLELEQKNFVIHDLNTTVDSIQQSISWTVMKKIQFFLDALFPVGKKRRTYYMRSIQGCRMLLREGVRGFSKIKFRDPYGLWIRKNEPRRNALDRLTAGQQQFLYRPRISIIIPVWNVEERWLRRAVESVIDQVYDNWELCIIDGGSTKEYIKPVLEEYARKDSRIKVHFLTENQGISGNSNAALALSTGEFVGFLDHDDELAPFALYEVVKTLNSNPDVSYMYSDEDKIDEKNRRLDPFFKPDWSPDMFLSCNYLCHFSVVRKKILDDIGGFRTEYDGSQDYDLLLRVTEKIKNNEIVHIPKILYHWRVIPDSAASSAHAKPYAYVAAKKALADSMARRKTAINGVSDGYWKGSYRIKYSIFPDPKISIIISAKDTIKELQRCIKSILDKTRYNNYEIVVVDNKNEHNGISEYYEWIKDNPKIRILPYDMPFNCSGMNNYAVSQVTSPYILFLDSNTEVISSDWLSVMLEHAQRENTGAVGAKLLYSNHTIEHAGIILGISGNPPVAGYAYRNLPDNNYEYCGYGQAHIIRNVSAISAACLLMKKAVFERIGGFDIKMTTAFSDIDLCLKLRQTGFLLVYTPYAKLFHHESSGRDDTGMPEKKNLFLEDAQYIREKWGDLIDGGDPYYNPNLTQDKEDFSIKN